MGGDVMTALVRGHYFSMEQISQHCDVRDCWIVLTIAGRRRVLDVTQFLHVHPGGPEWMLRCAGGYADAFEDFPHSENARMLAKQLVIGDLAPCEDERFGGTWVSKVSSLQQHSFMIVCLLAGIGKLWLERSLTFAAVLGKTLQHPFGAGGP